MQTKCTTKDVYYNALTEALRRQRYQKVVRITLVFPEFVNEPLHDSWTQAKLMSDIRAVDAFLRAGGSITCLLRWVPRSTAVWNYVRVMITNFHPDLQFLGTDVVNIINQYAAVQW